MSTKRDPQTVEQLWLDPHWDCPRCRSINLAIRDRCRMCGFDSALVSGGVYMPAEVIHCAD